MSSPRPLPTLPAARALPLVASRTAAQMAAGERVLILIDGPTGAGKSWLAGQLSSLLIADAEAHLRPVLSLDMLVPGWDALRIGVARARRLLVTLAHQGETVAPCEEQAVAVPTWDWERSCPGPPLRVTLPRGAMLLIEGCGVLAAAACPLPGLAVHRLYVQAPTALRHERIQARDSYSWDVAAWEEQDARLTRIWQGFRAEGTIGVDNEEGGLPPG